MFLAEGPSPKWNVCLNEDPLGTQTQAVIKTSDYISVLGTPNSRQQAVNSMADVRRNGLEILNENFRGMSQN